MKRLGICLPLCCLNLWVKFYSTLLGDMLFAQWNWSSLMLSAAARLSTLSLVNPILELLRHLQFLLYPQTLTQYLKSFGQDDDHLLTHPSKLIRPNSAFVPGTSWSVSASFLLFISQSPRKVLPVFPAYLSWFHFFVFVKRFKSLITM